MRRRIWISPDLIAEPVAAFYLRRGLGYRFVRSVLEEAFGAGHLHRLRRQTPLGPSQRPLDDDLRDVERICTGAHAAVSEQLGLQPDQSGG